MSLLPGQTIGPYTVVEQIGAGGMAAVYKAFQPSLSRHVAIKVLPASYALDPQYLERFRQEAVVIANLRHPNIVVVFDTGEQDGLTYIVMELIEGGTLMDRMRGALPLGEATSLLRPVASALDFAHSRGVVHRDVKPPNVLPTTDETPVLSDFGIARILEGSGRLTRTGMGIGTPEYIAPEQAMGETAGPAADNYALGVIAYEMLTGSLPFVSSTPMAAAIVHAQQPVPPPRTRNPALSEGVEAVLLKALTKRPEDRFASAADLVRALEESGAGLATNTPAISRAGPSVPPPRTPANVAETVPVSTAVEIGDSPRAANARKDEMVPTTRTRPRQPSRGLLVAGALATLVLVVGGVVGLRALAMPGPASPPDGPIPPGTPPKTLYEDTFDDPSAGRLPKNSPNPSQYTRGYVDGEYQIKVVDAGMRSIATASVPGIQSDATLTVDAHLVGDPASRYIDLVCRAQTNNAASNYRLEVDPNRRWFRLVRLDSGTIVPLVDWTPSSAILARNSPNTVELSCIGDTIAASVNGTHVASVQDATYRQGRMWIGLASVGRVGEARFDNLRVVGVGSNAGGEP